MKRKGKEKRTRHIGLRFKFILCLIIMGLSIATVAIIVGVNIYRSSIMESYTKMAYQVAKTAETYFTEEEIAAYANLIQRYNSGEAKQEEVDAVINSDRYKEIKSLLRNLQKSMEANDVFVCVFDMDQLTHYDAKADEKGEWLPICYITDCYHKEEEDFLFGDRSAVILEYMDDLIQSYNTGKRPDTYIVSESQFGYNTTAVYPIVQNDKTVAFCFVEIPMSTLQSDINTFITRVVLVASIVTIILLLLAISFLVHSMIRPIVFVAAEAERFTKNNNEISDELEKIQTHDEIQTLSENLLKLEIGINEYIDNLTKVTAEKERIGAELNVATQIQADMLPSIFPPFPDRKEFDIYATMTPAKEVGGDFYDFFLIDDDHLAMVIADVSGKGVPAALFMVIAKTLIKNRAQMGGSPSEILGYVNEQLCEGNEAELFVTVWLAIVELSTGKGVAANAGHEHPAIRRADGSFELVVYRHSPAVATMEGLKFREHEFTLNPGDSLYVYTDGVAEATNSDNELFGTERMLAALNRNPKAKAKDLLPGVKQEIDAFVGDAPQFDDITMLGLDYYGKENN